MKKILSIIFCTAVFLLCGCVVVHAIPEGNWQFPKNIKTYIQPGHKNSVMMRHAFEEWERVTNHNLGFTFVSSRAVAKIRVEFVKKIDTRNQEELDRAIGLTQIYAPPRSKKLLKANIWIADLTQDGRTLSRDEVYTTMLHELGHALGLNHTDDPESVMYPNANVIQEISKADLKRLSDRYGW